jgi:hypothetical protein
MGQIISFPTQPTPYPDQMEDLGTADGVLLLAIRWWVEDYRANADPIPRLQTTLHNAGAHDAAFPIDSLMTAVARGARRTVDVHCPLCPNLSDDEKHLLHAASLVQANNAPLAEKALQTALLSADGAGFAVESLEDLTELFTKARLFFSRRVPPAPLPDANDTREAWSPPAALH